MQEITNKLLSLLPSSPSKSSKKEESTKTQTLAMPTSKNNMKSLEDEVAALQLDGGTSGCYGEIANSEADKAQREMALAMADAYKNNTQAKQKQQQPQAVTLCTPQDIASLPLLQPFNIRNTNQSTIINTIINEQHSNDSLLSVLKREEELRKELALLKDGKSKKDSKDDDKKDGKDAKDDSKDVVEEKDVNGRAAALSNAKGGSKRDKKAAKKKKLSPKEEAKVKELEMNIDAINMLVKQQRESLAQFANWTKAMLQAEYSKLVITLDPESQQYADLEESLAFLCPRLGTSDSSDGTEDYYHEQRLTYVKELIPVINGDNGRSLTGPCVRHSPDSFTALPYLKKFQCCGEEGDKEVAPIIAALVDEMYQLSITQGIRKRFEKQLDDPAKYKVLKHVEDVLARKEGLTNDLVKKHYRKRSIKLHPDRNGEHMRPVFEEFTDARTVLTDIKLRQSYLRGMLDVVKVTCEKKFDKTPEEMIADSHEAWIRKHRPDKAETDVRGSKKKDKQGTGKTLKLEGGFNHQVPRGVMLHHRRDGKKSHVVSISINVLRPVHEFYARVRSIRVELRDTADGKHVISMKRDEIVKNIRCDRQGPILESEISVGELTLNPGNWEVFWYAELDTVGVDPLNPNNATDDIVKTTYSASATFRVTDLNELRKAQDFALAEQTCTVIKGELANTLHKLRTNQVDMSTPERFGHYHQVLVRARKKCANLHRLMELTGKPSTIHQSLSSLLGNARLVFAELERKADAAKKRTDRKHEVKRFKAYIASVLESDDPIGWMTSVGQANLHREGGDVNRLYQLFIEGKGKYTLLIDSEMYKAASLRDDLFSVKQCKELASRGEEVAITEAKEEEEAAIAEEKRQKEEKEREEMRRKAELSEKWAFVGQNATIHGLASEKGKHMNNQLGRVMYYSVEKDRFEVQLYSTEDKAYLKKENLTAYYGHIPEKKKLKQPSAPVAAAPKKAVVKEVSLPVAPPKAAAASDSWKCNQCTFANDEADTNCSMCTTPRTKKQKEPSVVVTNKVEKKKEPIVKKGQTTTKPAKAQPSKPTTQLPKVNENAKMKKTIYVRSSHSKKLTGKRGRKKKELICKSGADEIQIETSSIGNHVPVHLTGNKEAVWKAIALIQEAIGMENVTEKVNYKTPPASSSSPPTKTAAAISSPPGLVLSNGNDPPPAVVAPPPGVPPVSVEPKQPTAQARVTSPTGMFSGISKPFGNGSSNNPTPETQPTTSQYTFGDALLPLGLMDMSLPTPAVPPPEKEIPSVIGISSSQGMTRETITEASISSFNDRSNISKTHSDFTLNENDPLLVFLRSQHQCIKGSVDEFYIWLVKSEDIDCMVALKEAVCDDDYLNDSMKVGNGSSGLKGFKRKAFQRAVSEYKAPITPAPVVVEDAHSASQQASKASSNNGSNSMNGMNGNAFLPSNLFSGLDDTPKKSSIQAVTANLNEPPAELVCPISFALMVEDPVLAADGVTYERKSIEHWFTKSMKKYHVAQQNLNQNPHSESDQRIVRNGIVSPVHGTKLSSLGLTPNTSVRNMARTFKDKMEAPRF